MVRCPMAKRRSSPLKLKPKHVLVGLGALGFGALVLAPRKARATGVRKLPPNMTIVEGKLGLLSAGASVTAGGAFIIVGSDADHWKLMAKMVAARARANPQFEYVLVDMELARELASDRGEDLPADAWGGVVSILDGEFITQRYLGADVDKAEAREIIKTVEGTVPGLEGESMPALPPITAGFFPLPPEA